MAKQSTTLRIHNFFEKPSSIAAYLVQGTIFGMIGLSVFALYAEYKMPTFFAGHSNFFGLAEAVILTLFTVEYVLRIATAPKKMHWATRPLNVVDFFAVFPSYLEMVLPLVLNTSSLRVIRLLRVLRFARVLRILKVFKYASFFKKVFKYENTIFQQITPVLGILISLKVVIVVLEASGLWIADPSLGELFAIIGFALGIILSQKIATTYDKFLQVEEAAIRLYGNLRSVELIVNRTNGTSGTKATFTWAKDFLSILNNPKTDNEKQHIVNRKLYEHMASLEDTPAEMAILHGDICKDAAFCLSKKERLTPVAYDTLLHQSTILYLVMIAVFIPGLAGFISVVVASYTLYGMYNLTQDLDSIIGGEYNLINIDISELEKFVKERK